MRKRETNKEDKENKEYLSTVPKDEKAIISLIGEKGISEMNPLTSLLETEYSASKVRSCILTLQDKGIVIKEIVKTPKTAKLVVFWLSGYGKDIFEQMEGRKPIFTSAEEIKREHGSLTHGYAVLQLARALEETPFVKSKDGKATCMTRRKQIKLEHRHALVPDIIIGARGKPPTYIEYETTRCSWDDFYVKCNKLSSITEYLNFVVPNQVALGKIERQTASWIERTKNEQSLDHPVTIRLSTFRSIAASGNANTLNWDKQIRVEATNNNIQQPK